MIKRLYIVCLALIFGPLSCSSLTHQSMPEEDSVELELVKKKCTLCHGLPHPRRHSPDEWDHLLALMMERMKERKISYTSDDAF